MIRTTLLRRLYFSTLTCAMIGALTLTPAAIAETAGDGLIFTSRADLGGSKLTVTGPEGAVYEMSFAADEAPSFSLFDVDGNALVDGGYTYELRFSQRQLDNRPEGSDSVVASGGKANFANTVESGYFTVAGGSMVVPGVEQDAGGKADGELATAKAQVFATDLIVQGSGCIGFDCSSSESFGFDTLRLKENNLRIHFNDTSSSASFPGNDWRLTANDSSNGGANKFSIDDVTGGKTPFTILAGAPSNSLFIKADGKVGFGTASPVVDNHIVSGNSPTLRLEQDGSDGFTPQTWDLAGNETNFFVRDVTNGSNLPLRIKPGAPDNSIYINANGDLGIGTASPDSELNVLYADSGDGIHVKTTATGTVKLLSLEAAERPRLEMINNSVAGGTWNLDVLNGTGNFAFINFSGPAFTFETDGDLSIEGNFISNGMTLTVPDYVFEDDYQLMPLDKLEAYIAEESHLPNVPSAKEINAGSLNMTQMQLTLLEKVEELTLYTLQQQQLISQQQQAITALEQKVDALD